MLIQDTNAQIQKVGKMYTIVDTSTGRKHVDCEVDLFETEELARQYMLSNEDVKVKCGACHDFSMLSEWKVNENNNGSITCPICQGEFKDVVVIEEGMEAGMNCPNCLSDNSETYVNTRDNHCLDCGFNWKILNSIDLDDYTEEV